MRVIGGEFRRMPLKGAPDGAQTLRPTSDRVRENVFNILGDRIRDADFLDLFAGTGAVGIEALSRGARRTVFVETLPASLKIIRENVEKLGLLPRCDIVKMDAAAFTASAAGAGFDIIYADPPYGAGAVPKILRNLGTGKILKPDAVVITEQREKPDAECAGALIQADARKYGKTWIVIWKTITPEQGK